MENLTPGILNATRAVILRDDHILLLRKDGGIGSERFAGQRSSIHALADLRLVSVDRSGVGIFELVQTAVVVEVEAGKVRVAGKVFV